MAVSASLRPMVLLVSRSIATDAAAAHCERSRVFGDRPRLCSCKQNHDSSRTGKSGTTDNGLFPKSSKLLLSIPLGLPWTGQAAFLAHANRAGSCPLLQ